MLESWLLFYFILNWGLNQFSAFSKAGLAQQREAEPSSSLTDLSQWSEPAMGTEGDLKPTDLRGKRSNSKTQWTIKFS